MLNLRIVNDCRKLFETISVVTVVFSPKSIVGTRSWYMIYLKKFKIYLRKLSESNLIALNFETVELGGNIFVYIFNYSEMKNKNILSAQAKSMSVIFYICTKIM